VKLFLISDGTCKLDSVKNIDTEIESLATYFINGQTGILKFSCDGLDGDVAEGTFRIDIENVRNGLTVPSQGTFRLNINN